MGGVDIEWVHGGIGGKKVREDGAWARMDEDGWRCWTPRSGAFGLPGHMSPIDVMRHIDEWWPVERAVDRNERKKRKPMTMTLTITADNPADFIVALREALEALGAK